MKYRKYPKRSHHVFTLGNIGVGKSSVLGSLCRYVNRSPLSQLNYYPDPSEEAYRYLRENWLNRFINRKFPIRSRKGEFYQICVGFQLLPQNIEIKLTFQEIAGEDLMLLDRVDLTSEEEIGIKKEIYTYLKACGVIFMITTPESYTEDDPVFSYFFTRLKLLGIKKPVALIINKCDTIGEDVNDIREHLLANMPATAKLLAQHATHAPTQVFFYSTGVPKPGDKYTEIQEYRYPQYAPKVLNWLFNTLTI